MMEIPLEYWNTLANQFIINSALLGGFSITVIAASLNFKTTSRTSLNLQKAATVAAASFLVSIFAMTDMLMMTTAGYPLEISKTEFTLAQSVGGISFFIGILALMITIILSGWIKSRSMGIFTTVIGVIALLLIFMMVS